MPAFDRARVASHCDGARRTAYRMARAPRAVFRRLCFEFSGDFQVGKDAVAQGVHTHQQSTIATAIAPWLGALSHSHRLIGGGGGVTGPVRSFRGV